MYEYEATGNSAVSALTHWQFTANGTYEPWTVRMYVDGESTASVVRLSRALSPSVARSLCVRFSPSHCFWTVQVISEWMGGACESCGWGLLLPPDRPWGVERLGKGSAWPGL
eukprot:COSAG03_NODE_2500_length_2694_cov_15.273988_3_plen_112_part_00